MFDINFFTLNFISAQEQPDLSGLLVTAPPRRPERNRTEDMLTLMVSMAGQIILSQEENIELLEKLAASYYSSRGTTTSAMQACADELNQLLLKANARRSSADGQVLAFLNLAVLRRDHLYFAHAGTTHSILINTDDFKHFAENQGTTRTVGLGRSTRLVFSQSKIEAGSVLVMCPRPPASWTEEKLNNCNQLSLENLRRRLVSQAEDSLQAAVFQFQNGNGTIRRLKRRTKNSASSPSGPEQTLQKPRQPVIENTSANQTDSAPRNTLETIKNRLNIGATSQNTRTVVQPQKPTRQEQPSFETPKQDDSFTSQDAGRITRENEPQSRSSTIKREKRKKTVSTRHYGERIRTRLAGIWKSGSDFIQNIKRNAEKIINRILPGLDEQPLNLSNGAMVVIAIAVPLIVVAAATTVYIRNGRYEQHHAYLEQAQLYASNAQNQEDVTLKRMAWEKTIEWIDTAENYAHTEESTALRETANLALDELDGIDTFRVEMALSTSLDKNIEITSMAANNTEAYLLDSNSGNISRLFLSSNAYELDPSFECGPGLVESTYVNELVDMVSLPLNNTQKASVLAIDDKGNLVYCRPNNTPLSKSLIPPDQPWGKISALALQSDLLYVLDIASNALWVYQGNGLNFEDEPTMFFGNDIPDMKSVVDFAINSDSLYLLHKDGKITVCLYSPYDFSPTSCSETSTFVDMRPGQENQPVNFVGSRFSGIQATYPLEPSIFTLETEQGFIYHLSLQLNLHHQYRPEPASGYLSPTRPPTAFTITPGRILLLAYQNQVYFSALP